MSSLWKSLMRSFALRNVTLLIQFGSSLLILRLLPSHEIGVFPLVR